jgi:RNA polymerase II-associated factor 1
MSSSHRPSGGGSHGHHRRPDARKSEAIKIDLTDDHTPLTMVVENLRKKTGIKSHFICKMKLRNELPELPFEPKFLAYPAEQNRLTRYSCTNLEKSHKHALLTEPDLGIHIDLIEPETYEPPASGVHMQPEDEALLRDEEKKIIMRPGLEGDRGKRPNVPWMHKTQYYGNEDLFDYQQGFKNCQQELLPAPDIVPELSPMQHAEALQKSFSSFPSSLADVKHPIKKNVTAVKCWDILPDWNTWGNDYTEIVFDHDPTTCDSTVARHAREEKTKEASEAGDRKRKILGSTAFMHIRRGDPKPRRGSFFEPEEPPKVFGFFLPAPGSKRRKRAEEEEDAGADGDDETEHTEFHCVREHVENEAKKDQGQWLDDHYVVAFVDGDDGLPGRAVYHPIKSRTYLRKCKDVISFEDLDKLHNNDLRAMKKRGNRFPKYFKGLLQVRALDASDLKTIDQRRAEIAAGSGQKGGGGGDDEMEEAGDAVAGEARESSESSSSPEPTPVPASSASKKAAAASSSSSSSEDE